MNRRDVALTLLALGIAICSRSMHAQQATPAVIGYLGSTSGGATGSLAAFRLGLKQSGAIEGHDFIIEEKWAGGQYDRLPAMAVEFVKRKVNVILGATLPSALAAKAATSTIPIVFVVGADPVKLGLVDSLSHPGSNLTGVAQRFGDVGAKRLELLNEIVPNAKIIAVLSNRSNPNAETSLREIQAAATALKKKILVFDASSEGDIDIAFTNLGRARVEALIMGDDPVFNARRRQIITLAANHRIPTIHYLSEFVDAGGLVSYGSSNSDNYRLAGTYVDKILKGVKPSDLPILQPTTFELIVNLKTAKALKIKIPQAILARSDRVIE